MTVFDDYALARLKMVKQQLERRGIHSRSVLAAMSKVPRERFMLAVERAGAYEDHAAAIGYGQTISQPYIVGIMTQALELSGNEKVLEIGTGSGYQTAILAELAAEVISIERHPQLGEGAKKVLDELGYNNISLVAGDGTLGWPNEAPFDHIIVTAAAHECPPALFKQLREGGILVIPIGGVDSQVLQAIHKIGGRPQSMDLTLCRFVPLVGQQGWPEKPSPIE